jgi:hypothetical protein
MWHGTEIVGFYALTAVVLDSCIFWDIALCNSRLVYFWTLKMEVTCFSETSVDFQLTTRRYIPEYIDLKSTG